MDVLLNRHADLSAKFSNPIIRDKEKKLMDMNGQRKPQVPGGTWGCLWDSCSEGAGNRGLFDHHLLTIDDVQTLGGSDDALAGDVVDGLACGLTSGDVVNAGVEWSLNPADGRLANLVATVVDACEPRRHRSRCSEHQPLPNLRRRQRRRRSRCCGRCPKCCSTGSMAVRWCRRRSPNTYRVRRRKD